MGVRSLNTDENSRPVFSSGRLTFLRGADGLRKRLNDRLQFFKGSWFADRTVGLDASFLGTKTSPNAVRAIIAREILATEGVAELVSIQVTLDASTRQISGTYVAKSAEGLVDGSIEGII